jgi:hypothetical protein
LLVILFAGGLGFGQTVWEQHPDNPVIAGDASPGGVVFDGLTYHLYFSTGWSLDGGSWEILHATSPDRVLWTMDPNNPVMTRGEDGEWDDDGLYGIAVIHDGTEFHLWYGGSGYPFLQLWRAGYATSPDGSTWTKYSGNPVIDVGSPGSFDDRGVVPRSVLFDGETYRMWYMGTGRPAPSRPRGWSIGYAESIDGIAWTKHPTSVLEPGTSGEWDDGWLYAPAVVFDGFTFHMWYSGRGGVGADTAIGYAYSRDGIDWAKHYENPVLEAGRFASAPCVLFDGFTFHMWFRSLDDGIDGINHATSDCCLGIGNLYFIPAAAYASGAQGAFFRTDVDMNNADDLPATYQFIWLPRRGWNGEPVTSDFFTLQPGMSARYENVLSEVFDLQPDALGALAIRTNSFNLLLMSRTYNVTSAKAAGTFGQMMPAIAEADMIPHLEKRRIIFMSENDDYRANMGCQSGDRNGVVNVRIELFDNEGNILGTDDIILRPWSNDQFNHVFSDYAPVSGYVDIWTTYGDAPVYCYGSVLDNQTSDPTTILPQ